jgi:regulator of replication initiation timing
MMPAHEMAGTFAVKKTARGNASGALLEQGAQLAPPSSNDTFSDFHKFVAQYADSDIGKELKAAELQDERADPKKRGRHRRHLEARSRMLDDIKTSDHRNRLRKRDQSSSKSAAATTASRGSSSSVQRSAPVPNARTSSRAANTDFARRANAVAGAIGGGGNGGGGSTARGGGGGSEASAIEALKTQLERAQNDADEYKADVRQLRAENDTLRADNVKLSAKLAEAKAGRGGSSSTDEKVEKYKAKVAKLEDDVKKYKAERDRVKKERDDYKARLRAAESSGGGGGGGGSGAGTAQFDDHYARDEAPNLGPSFEQYDDSE